MTAIVKKFTAFIVTSALSAGVIFCCGFAFRVPPGVVVDGIEVGGMTYGAACALLRKDAERTVREERLLIRADDRELLLGYPDIGYTDNISKILHGSKKDGVYASITRYYLKGGGDMALSLAAELSNEKTEPYARFNAEGESFTYYQGRGGIYCCADELLKDINYSLNNGFTPVYARTIEIPCELTADEVKRRTSLLYSFSTFYDEENVARSGNIALACRSLNGTIIAPSGIFSFNSVVGARTAERGYRAAKIISGGRYVEGVGGGVCQVSTTLYNAVILSGLEIRELHPHSLGVSYVAPSRDAMVSGNYYDFKFKNNTGFPVYIRAAAARGKITCSVYGRGDGWNYSFLSEVTGTLPPPEPEYGAAVEITPRDGVESEGYLVREKNGLKVKTLVRRDEYAPVRGAVRGSGGSGGSPLA